ncbi:hypothetical protein [Paraeggerthella sp.]|uniref:beta-sandwich lipoprotein n=1 Tax=Paraeggerthella sp. TaxID=2897350 RepID=UPI003AB164D0
MRKTAAFAIASAIALSLCGCSAASTASQQVSVAADNFEVVRELTVFNNVTGEILFIAQGRMSVEVDDVDSQLEIMVAQPDGKYEKHFVGLNETTTYVVKDLAGVDVDSFRYKIVINPDMILPFEPKLVTGGAE